ncbi:MAG: sigma-E factor negative regulatory protein [Pseudomonadota bacterium]|nr:sigma-E factor negative regulatory protein [Pseudomonadota bacterium]
MAEINQTERETMSALMDGEASAFESHKLLRLLQSDSDRQALRLEWARLHATSAAMRGEVNVGGGALSTAFADRVALALTDENPKPAATARWGRAVAGLGVAASVASAVVLGARLFLIDPAAPTLVEEQHGAAESSTAPIASMPLAPRMLASPVGLNAKTGALPDSSAAVDPLDPAVDRAASAARLGSSVQNQ